MWFRNLTIYRLAAGWSWPAHALEEALARRALRPCSALEMTSRGWVAPGPGARLVCSAGPHQLIALGIEHKLLPASVVRQEAARRAQVQAKEQGFALGRRQLAALRHRVREELCARALSRQRTLRAWIDPTGARILVDSPSDARAEELIDTLRETLGSLEVRLIDTERSASSAMAAWLTQGAAPGTLQLDQDLELQAADAGRATVRYVRHPFDSREVRPHLASGKRPTRLGLTWKDRISFVLTDKLQLRRIAFLELEQPAQQPEAPASADGDPEAQLEADFTVMAGELAGLLTEVLGALGGEAAPRKAAA